MKSLFIVNDFPPILGGQSSYYFDLCRAFDHNEVLVLAPVVPGYQAVDSTHPLRMIRKSYLFRLPVLEKIGKIILPLVYSLPLIKKENITCVHCAHVLSTGVVGVFLKKLTGVSYIVYTHSADILEYQKNPLIKSVLKCVLNQAFRVVCNSRFTLEKLQELGVSCNKINLIYPKTDSQEFFPSQEQLAKNRYGLENKKIILSLNRLVERKGNDVVIRAMPKVVREIPEAVYAIGGTGPHLEKLQLLVKELQLESHIVFLGAIDKKDLVKVYSMCDVFVMNSRTINDQDTEGFGIAFLEAGACAKPVIGGKSGGIPEAVADGYSGFLTDPLDSDELANVMIRLLNDECLARQLGENGRKRVLESFDRRLLSTEIRELMKDL